jgi:hypothetical protein
MCSSRCFYSAFVRLVATAVFAEQHHGGHCGRDIFCLVTHALRPFVPYCTYISAMQCFDVAEHRKLKRKMKKQGREHTLSHFLLTHTAQDSPKVRRTF